MKKLFEKLKSVSKVQWLALALIIIGVAIMIPKAKGMVDFYKEAQYATENHFHDGNVSPDLIRPKDEHSLYLGGVCGATKIHF